MSKLTPILVCLVIIQLAESGTHFGWFTWCVFALVFLETGHDLFKEGIEIFRDMRSGGELQ